MSFWDSLPRPFFALAPLADVTDAAFRRVIAKYSLPVGGQENRHLHVMYTEFVSADGLVLAPEEGRKKLLRDLMFTPAERPIVAQLFTSVPEHMECAAALVQEMGFDGVDINMGCPAEAIERQGAGAKLILNSRLACEIIAAAKRGAPALPVSVKTRVGYNKDILDDWLPALLAAQPAAVAVHARTRKEMSAVPARWERVKRAVEIRNELKSATLIVGNGDLTDVDDAKEKVRESGADGAMLGRAIFGRPWLFSTPAGFAPLSPSDSQTRGQSLAFQIPPTVQQRLRIAVEHTTLFEELLGDIKSFAIMKKHFKAYCEGFPGAKELRVELMETNSAAQVAEVIERFLAAAAV